ncbi:hypothetical protein HK099_003751 [Clydaea vesicula]|uniref:Peptidase M20 domain-containing protein 2 n=1 Tax=Clydaea vesicula TaxID=447962 RepID=A0AAD5U744_9FUNG|nr:hypothetical protein HK099_003751 [Clydaea vesicula]KAJ3396174.1 hypothetical protein HDU92_003846 [Lobulomyces angularis]
MSAIDVQIFDFVKRKALEVSSELREISLAIHCNPEIGFEEKFAHNLLTSFLEKKGFDVTRSACGMETAFIAKYSPENIIKEKEKIITTGFLSEYDALPKIGHACGHNLICIAGIGSALIFKSVIDELGITNLQIKLFGSPAEEGEGGKIIFIENGAFKGIDFALMAHPGSLDIVYANFLALQHFTCEYFGKAAHASASPWNGTNALDAQILAYQNIACLRQQVLPYQRIHGIINYGGAAPNIIPDYTKSSWMCRSPTQVEVRILKDRLDKCFEASSNATGCKVELNTTSFFYEVKRNDSITSVFKKWQEKQGVLYTSREFQESVSRGSTDMGNVSYVVPSIHPVFSIVDEDDPKPFPDIHTEPFREVAKSLKAHSKTLTCIVSLVMSALEISFDKELLKKVKKEFLNN